MTELKGLAKSNVNKDANIMLCTEVYIGASISARNFILSAKTE
jgi:hypothetical protein